MSFVNNVNLSLVNVQFNTCFKSEPRQLRRKKRRPQRQCHEYVNRNIIGSITSIQHWFTSITTICFTYPGNGAVKSFVITTSVNQRTTDLDLSSLFLEGHKALTSCLHHSLDLYSILQSSCLICQNKTANLVILLIGCMWDRNSKQVLKSSKHWLPGILYYSSLTHKRQWHLQLTAA